ncbi:MAG: hypothetical protein ACKVYV_02435 [Limisphaerales bacterium]
MRAAGPGFALRAADSVNGAYNPVNDPVVVDGDENVLTVPAGGTAEFFLCQR